MDIVKTELVPHPAIDNFYRVQFLRAWEEWVRGTASQMIHASVTGADLERNVSEMCVAYSVLCTLRSQIGMSPIIVLPTTKEELK